MQMLSARELILPYSVSGRRSLVRLLSRRVSNGVLTLLDTKSSGYSQGSFDASQDLTATSGSVVRASLCMPSIHPSMRFPRSAYR